MPSSMELREFIRAITASPVLDDERRERYRRTADSLSPERRAEIVSVLRRHEDDFLAAVREREARAADDSVADAHRSVATRRETASRELEVARARLDEELARDLAGI